MSLIYSPVRASGFEQSVIHFRAEYPGVYWVLSLYSCSCKNSD